MRNFFLTLSSLFVAALFYASVTYAQNATCTPVYGGGPTCSQNPNLSINKEVQEPESTQFRDNLTANSNRFKADQLITFRITVKNTSRNALSNIEIKDVLPGYITYVRGEGTIDSGKRTFTAKIDKLDAGKSKAITLTGRIVKADALPASPNPLCISNQATARTGDLISTDNTNFCIANGTAQARQNTQANGAQPTTRPNAAPTASTRNVQPTTGSTTKGGFPVYSQPNQAQTPPTGPEMLALAALLPSGIAGIFLRKMSK